MIRFTRFLLFIFCLAPVFLFGQNDFSRPASGKTIKFVEIDALSIVGVSGGDMLISRPEKKGEGDKRAAGLRKISATGLTDNTGMGLSITEEDGVISVRQVGNSNRRLKVSVPNSAKVHVSHSGVSGGKLVVEDFGGELDADLGYQSAELSNLSGLTAVNSIYGSIEASFATVPSQEVRLLSSYSTVDLSVPGSAKFNVSLSTSYGDMYTDFDINVKANTANGNSSGRLNGAVNGGGTKISLTATYSDIYLRKK